MNVNHTDIHEAISRATAELCKHSEYPLPPSSVNAIITRHLCPFLHDMSNERARGAAERINRKLSEFRGFHGGADMVDTLTALILAP